MESESIRIITNSSSETKKIAQCLGSLLLELKVNELFFIALFGDLGAGKTTFVQGLASGLGIKEKILSPTFVLMKSFEIPKSVGRHFYHLDCYRLKNYQELKSINFKEILKDNPPSLLAGSEPRRDNGNIVVMEWADRVKKALPKNYLKIKIKHLEKNKREIEMNW